MNQKRIISSVLFALAFSSAPSHAFLDQFFKPQTPKPEPKSKDGFYPWFVGKRDSQNNNKPNSGSGQTNPNSGSTPASPSKGSITNYSLPGGQPWIIKKTTWDESDEQRYADFITSLYKSGCKDVPSCMEGKGNWYRDKDKSGIRWYADCGRFPYLTRAYFAFHNGLPFQAGVNASKIDPSESGPTKYSSKGNFISTRWNVKSGTNGYQTIKNIVQAVFSQSYRVSSLIDVDATNRYGDHYHVKLDRKFIRPGTIVYDPNGHIAMVGEVTTDGKIILLDSHPDNSVSRVDYSSAFEGRSARQGGGFKNWRKIIYDMNTNTSRALPNAEQIGFSMEQIFGDQNSANTSFRTAKWSTSDGILSSSQFQDVVRARLSVGAVIYKPIQEIKESMNSLCLAMEDRILSVKEAITKGIDRKSMPNGKLPENIYGTSGEWEDYSTPSRDARLKTAVNEFYLHVKRMYDLYQARNRKVSYEGTDLAADMLQAFEESSRACQLSYTNTAGNVVRLNLEMAFARLYRMSFDPYHCIEQRMGASEREELGTCVQSESKNAWYKAQQSLRNSLNRGYDIKMFWSLEDLQKGADLKAGAGTFEQKPVDVGGLIRSFR